MTTIPLERCMHVQSCEQKTHLSNYLGTGRRREKKPPKDGQELSAIVKQVYL